MITNINCPKCNQSIPPQVDICPHCGTQLRAQAQPDDVAANVIKNDIPDVLKQLESTANINLTIAGALVTFYTTGIFAGKVQASDWWHAALYALPILILLFVIFAALRVFYPRGYLKGIDDILFIEKDRRLQISTYLLEAAIVFLIFAVFFYLIR